MIKRGGIRIGITGLTTHDSGSPLKDTELIFEDELVCAENIYPEVAEKSDIVIALTHIGVEMDRRLARELPGLSAIIGGHSHTELSVPRMEGNVPIVQAGSFGLKLGRLDLSFVREGDRWTLSAADGKLLPVEEYDPDPAVLKLYAKFEKKIKN